MSNQHAHSTQQTVAPSNRRRSPQKWATQQGQAVVEAAGSLMVFLMLVVGIVDFSPIVVRTAQLTQAVRDGASVARTMPTNVFEVRKRVVLAAPAVFGSMTDAQIAAMTNSQIAVTCTTGLTGPAKPCASAVVGDAITVSSTYNFQTLTGLFSVLLFAPLEITRSATSEIF
jgi:Flp pilus assembly protein TadG